MGGKPPVRRLDGRVKPVEQGGYRWLGWWVRLRVRVVGGDWGGKGRVRKPVDLGWPQGEVRVVGAGRGGTGATREVR